jgi:rare lipoprotein A (peptidoglycan hydrolase)
MKKKHKDSVSMWLWIMLLAGMVFMISMVLAGYSDVPQGTTPSPAAISISSIGPGDIESQVFNPGVEKGISSWYGPGYHGRTMANGKVYNQYALTIACNHLPLGTTVRITNPSTGLTCMATVTDRGPFVKGRKYDCSYMVAHILGFVHEGLATLEVQIKA